MSVTPRKALAEIKTPADRKTRKTRLRNLAEEKATHLAAKQDEIQATGTVMPKEVSDTHVPANVVEAPPPAATDRPRRRRIPVSLTTVSASQPDAPAPAAKPARPRTKPKAATAKSKATATKATRTARAKTTTTTQTASQPTPDIDTDDFHSCLDPDSRASSQNGSNSPPPPDDKENTLAPEDKVPCEVSIPSMIAEEVSKVSALQSLPEDEALQDPMESPMAHLETIKEVHARPAQLPSRSDSIITQQSTAEQDDIPLMLDARPRPETPTPAQQANPQRIRSPCFGYSSPPSSGPHQAYSAPAIAPLVGVAAADTRPEEAETEPPAVMNVRLGFQRRPAVPIESHIPENIFSPAAPVISRRRDSDTLQPYIPPSYIMSLNPFTPTSKRCDLDEDLDSSPEDLIDLLASPEPERDNISDPLSPIASPIRLVPPEDHEKVREQGKAAASVTSPHWGGSATRYNPLASDFSATPTRGDCSISRPQKTVPALTPSRQPVSFGAVTPTRKFDHAPGQVILSSVEATLPRDRPVTSVRDGVPKPAQPPPTPTRRRHMVKPTCKDLFPDMPESELRPKDRNRKAEYYYNEFNREVFDNRLPHRLPLIWNARLRKTAGQAVFVRTGNKESRSHDADDEEAELVTMVQNLSLSSESKSIQTTMIPRRIELAPKILVTEQRLASTLLHECCHIAQRTLEIAVDPPHGPIFKRWAARASRRYPEFKVSTRHDYEIHQPHQWKCLKCGVIYKRFSRSINVDKHRCGTQNCGGVLVYLGEFLTNGILKPPNMRQLTPYNDFVRAMYDKAVAEAEDPRDVMTIIAGWWKERQKEEEDAENEL